MIITNYDINYGGNGKFDQYGSGFKDGVAMTEDRFNDAVCQIIFEGENTAIGNKITLDRIKEFVKYERWLNK